MAAASLLRPYDAETARALDDLVRESLRLLLPVTVAVMWVWASVSMMLDETKLLLAVLLFGLIAASCWFCDNLRLRNLAVAVAIYLIGLGATVTAIAIAFPGAATLYLYLLVVLVATVLTDPRAAWALAIASAILVLIVGQVRHLLLVHDLASPLLLILVTALTSWLSSRRLYTALHWALSMTEQAQRNAQDARERRAEVRSILKSLEEAYVRLERANQALIFAREAAEKAYRFKAEFVANVSHELRTPLNLIVGFSEMMATAPESYKGRRLPRQYRGDVMAIYRSARHLSDLIDDVLDLSQIEAGRLPLAREATDPGEIIREANEIVRGLAEAKGLQIIVDLPQRLPLLRLDRTRIRQVLLNLLSNATRFTDQGWIRTQAWIEAQEVRITVQDSGRGIAQDRIDQAFEAFSQLDEDRARQGSGLGLAVSRKFVELHGGSMWIESTLGRGTTVGFALPVTESDKGVPLAVAGTRTPVPGRSEQPSVLVLHDDARAVTLLRRYVEGYQFVLADTVDRARELVLQTPPRAVIAERSSSVRWSQVLARVDLPAPVPVLTCSLPSVRRLALLLGAADFLLKPLRREELVAALARLPRQPRAVLVIDDDPDFARLVVRVLKAHNSSLNVLVASGGKEGLAIARSERPDLVLLDLLMPEVSGYDFLEEAKRDPGLADISIIILSARSLEEEAKPLDGRLWLEHSGGFGVGETLALIRAMLAAITQPDAVAPASAAAALADPPA